VKITEIRVKLMTGADERGEKLKAFCSVTFDNEIVVRDVKLIEGPKGLFVAMPSRKLMGRCPRCRGKNALRARFCNECGRRLREEEAAVAEEPGIGRRLYADVAHPIHARARDLLQRAVVEAYEHELVASRKEGYQPPRFDDLDYEDESDARPRPAEREQSAE
jgi:stage V sporulation protein G